MTEEQARRVGKGEPANDFSGVAVDIEPSNGRVSLKARTIIAGKRAALVLPEWLDEDTPDIEGAARTALRRAALSILEELESSWRA